MSKGDRFIASATTNHNRIIDHHRQYDTAMGVVIPVKEFVAVSAYVKQMHTLAGFVDGKGINVSPIYRHRIIKLLRKRCLGYELRQRKAGANIMLTSARNKEWGYWYDV